MLVLSTVALCYFNSFTDGSISPEYFGTTAHLIKQILLNIQVNLTNQDEKNKGK